VDISELQAHHCMTTE